ncbi:hypothetical protein POM88_002407 [Heracleum sosnowskyi]|uniref:PPC domain-containing protein n=1 Tax=Heracleum sosnowskyi TaxID=360622 RepID=A0AAD8JEB4_9APIA|nr:hypothetical protein POM88_002407 [Heracleum sosnowskyi]
MYTSMSNIGGPPTVLPTIDIPMSDFGNIPPTLSNMKLQILDTRNIQPTLSKMESPILDNTNSISYDGVALSNRGTPMFGIANGVAHGSDTLPNNQTPMFITNGDSYGDVTLPNLETPMFNFTNGVPYGGAILPEMEAPIFNNTYGIPYSGITLPNMDTPMFNIVKLVPYGNVHHRVENRGRPIGSKNKPRGENSAMRSVILQVPAGTDLVGWVVAFAKAKKIYITVQGGNVAVSEAHISFSDPATPQIYKEHLTLLNFSGACLFSCSKKGSATYFNASLSRKDGVVGGATSKIITICEMVLSATVFKNPELLKLKPEIQKGHVKDPESP